MDVKNYLRPKPRVRPAYKHFKVLAILLYGTDGVARHGATALPPSENWGWWVTLDVRTACEAANMKAEDLRDSLTKLATIGLVRGSQWHGTYVVLQVKQPEGQVLHG